jgi:hypothetical protein
MANKTTGVKIIYWKEIREIRGKFQGEDDLEELPHTHTHIYIYEYQLSETRSSYWNYFPVVYCKDIQDQLHNKRHMVKYSI